MKLVDVFTREDMTPEKCFQRMMEGKKVRLTKEERERWDCLDDNPLSTQWWDIQSIDCMGYMVLCSTKHFIIDGVPPNGVWWK